jgi:hypothetical protein
VLAEAINDLWTEAGKIILDTNVAWTALLNLNHSTVAAGRNLPGGRRS